MRFGRFSALIVLPICLFVFRNSAFAEGNLLLNPGAEEGTGVQDGSTATNWTVGGESNPGRDDGTFDSGLLPHSGNFDFYGGTGAFGTLTQQVNLINNGFTVTQLDSRTLSANVSFWEMSLDQGDPSDAAGVSLTFRNAGGGAISTAVIPPIYFKEQWHQVSQSFPLPTGTRLIDYTMNFMRNNGSDLDSFIDDNSLILGPPMTCAPGDANMDGKVDFADLLILAQHYGKSPGQTCAQGDFNSDGGVGFDDLLILAQHYGKSTAATIPPVPEPTAAVGALALALLLRRRRLV